jgi:hypothetical protein
MKDMLAQLEKFRTQAAECEIVRNLATQPGKRALFADLAERLKVLAADVERAMASAGAGDTFLGRKTQEPFPKEQE